MNKFKKYMLLVLAVVLLGEVYFHPFDHLIKFRFSAGIIVLNLIILIYENVSTQWICIFSGISVFSVRYLLSIGIFSASFYDALLENFPAIIYYIIYGFFARTIPIQKYKHQCLLCIILLACIDILSNTFELFVRNQFITPSFIQITVMIALARSTIAYFIYLVYKKQELFLLTREHQKRYSQLNILMANIQAEMFYLKKSTLDIENVMKKSYKLYEKYKQDSFISHETLEIARAIHEIKKDYYRVLTGFECFLETFEENGTMMLDTMKNIILENTHRYLQKSNKHIDITFHCEDHFELLNYYYLFTVLNNLIINAIDACNHEGHIHIHECSNDDCIIFRIQDDGEGIEDEMIPLIFNPGFTTKYDEKSGEPSTGIGLSHVKNIIKHLQGSIHVQSHIHHGTTFKFKLPKKSLVG